MGPHKSTFFICFKICDFKFLPLPSMIERETPYTYIWKSVSLGHIHVTVKRQ